MPGITESNKWVRVLQANYPSGAGRSSGLLKVAATGGQDNPGELEFAYSFNWGAQATIHFRGGAPVKLSKFRVLQSGDNMYLDILLGTFTAGTRYELSVIPETLVDVGGATTTIPLTINPVTTGNSVLISDINIIGVVKGHHQNDIFTQTLTNGSKVVNGNMSTRTDGLSEDTFKVNGWPSATVHSNAQTGWDLTQFNSIVLDPSSFGTMDLADLDPTRQGKLDGVAPGADVTSANKSSGLVVPDVRNDDQPPSFYRTKGTGVYSEFKLRSVIGAPGTSVYGVLDTQVPWVDSSGGPVTQIFRSNDGEYRRVGTADDLTPFWGAWGKSYDGINKPDYSADLIGTKPPANADVTNYADDRVKNSGIQLNADGTMSYWNGSSWVSLGGTNLLGLGFTGANNANYITNTNQLSDGAGLGVNALWGNIAGQTNAPASNADVTNYTDDRVKNSGIQLNADGTMSYWNGSSWVSLGAALYGSLPGKPTEITDGRIAAGLDAAGTLISKVKDQTTLPPILVTGTGRAFNTQPVSSSADNGASASITIAPSTVHLGSGLTVSYPLGVVAGLLHNTTYHIYGDDTSYSGTLSGGYVATQTFTDVASGDGRIYFGSHTTVASGGGTGGTWDGFFYGFH